MASTLNCHNGFDQFNQFHHNCFSLNESFILLWFANKNYFKKRLWNDWTLGFLSMKTGCVCVSHAIREGFSSLIKMCERLLFVFVAWLSSDILRYFHRFLSFKIDCWQKFQMETIYLSRIFFLVHSLLFCYDHRNEHRKNNWNRNKRKWLQCDEHNDQLLKWAITALPLLVNREYRDNNWANIYSLENR